MDGEINKENSLEEDLLKIKNECLEKIKTQYLFCDGLNDEELKQSLKNQFDRIYDLKIIMKRIAYVTLIRNKNAIIEIVNSHLNSYRKTNDGTDNLRDDILHCLNQISPYDFMQNNFDNYFVGDWIMSSVIGNESNINEYIKNFNKEFTKYVASSIGTK